LLKLADLLLAEAGADTSELPDTLARAFNIFSTHYGENSAQCREISEKLNFLDA